MKTKLKKLLGLYKPTLKELQATTKFKIELTSSKREPIGLYRHIEKVL